ncbi:MAG: branched-chain amino acid ABC transporter permease [Candidatus Bathyarchaeia archaeon]
MQLDSSLFLELIIHGLFQGAIYALIGTGLTLIWGTMQIVNFAHCTFMTLAAYTAFWLFTLLNFDPLLSLPVVLFSFFLAGVLFERFMVEPLIEKRREATLLLTLGVSLIIQNTILYIWKANPHYVNSAVAGTLRFFGLNINAPRFVSFIIATIAALLLHLFLTRTTYGTAIRGTCQNRTAAYLMGINVKKIYALSFGLGMACAGLAGVLVCLFFPIDPFIGDPFLVMTFVVIVMGGLGNYIGAIFSGFMLGVIEYLAAYWIGSLLRLTIPLLVFIAVLLVRPRGLFGG